MYKELKGKTALITGASRGFGRAAALRLAKEGVKIIINYKRNRADAEKVMLEIDDMGGEALAIKADVGNSEKVFAMFDVIKSEYNKLDILVANASFGIPVEMMNVTSKYWDVTMNSSAKSLLLLAQLAQPLMKNGGKIISLTSLGGQRVIPGYGMMGPAKAALESITRYLAYELASKNIIVNGIMPGLADTKSVRTIPGHTEMIKKTIAKTPMGRLVTPKEVANVIAFLASDQANMICGQFITIDGGAIINS